MRRNIHNNKSRPGQQKQAPGDDKYLKILLVNQAVSIRKKKSCPLKGIDISDITYKNLRLLGKFLTERGKILPSRITNVELKKQRALATAIKGARQLALLSPIKGLDA